MERRNVYREQKKGAYSYGLLLSALQETERPIFIFDPKGKLEGLQIQADQKEEYSFADK